MTVVSKIYVTLKDNDAFRKNYEARRGSVDEISHAFGVAYHYAFYFTMDGWCQFLDSVFPDVFPFGTVQDLLIAVVKYVYDNRAEHNYNSGVDMGRSIVGKVTDTINWAQSQINNAVTDMRNRIDSEIVEPVRQKAAEIEKTLNWAQTRINGMGTELGRFSSDVETMKGNISSFDGSIKSFDSKLASFKSTLNWQETRASGLQTQLGDAQAKLNEFKTLMDDISRRVDNLENKQKEGFDFLKSIGWKKP